MNRKEDIKWLKDNKIIDDVTPIDVVRTRLYKMDLFRSIDNYYNDPKMRGFVSSDFIIEEFDAGYLYESVYYTHQKQDGIVYLLYGYVYRIDRYHGIRSYHIVDRRSKLSMEAFEPNIYRSRADVESKFIIKNQPDNTEIIVGDKK